MKYTTSGFGNLAAGYAAGKSIDTGERNIALGYEAIGQGNSAQCTGDNNICIGYESGKDLTSGSGNIIIGSQDGLSTTTTGSDNIAIGNDINLTAAGGGLIHIGNRANNTNSIIDVSGSHQVMVGGGFRLVVNATDTRVSNNLKVVGMLLDSNNYARDCPNSFHASGSGATEVRHMKILPNMLKADDDATDGAYAEVVADSGTDPYTTISGAEYNMGMRLSSGVSEG
jgi:hypothetical protein